MCSQDFFATHDYSYCHISDDSKSFTELTQGVENQADFDAENSSQFEPYQVPKRLSEASDSDIVEKYLENIYNTEDIYGTLTEENDGTGDNQNSSEDYEKDFKNEGLNLSKLDYSLLGEKGKRDFVSYSRRHKRSTEKRG